ncbi:hypothetical protein IJ556_00355 [bacterium]|nr:hypothetical protein [bacterium]MBR2273303.1 hypothetical protein [Alphaproteobacteria bacterium]
MQQAKIGIDFHGVISAAPQQFAIFCQEIRRRGIAVYIISGGPKPDIMRYLETHHIEYDVIWAILDYCEAQGTVHFYEDGSFQVPTAIWDKAKACYCAEQNILFHIDDSPIYGKYFTTPYCEYDICQNRCIALDKEIDFSQPYQAAADIAALITQQP